MTVNNSIYIITCLFLHEVCKCNCSVARVVQLITAQEGDNVSLPCLLPNVELHRALWYKQVLGEKPFLIVSSYHHSQPNEFSPDFQDAQRFRVVRKDHSFNLTILRTLKSDSGMYLCAAAFANIVSFTTGSVLLVKGADPKPTVIQHPALGVIKPGSNVTLQCSVQAKTCDKGVHVYWFKRGLNTINPGVVYTQGDMENGCEKTSATSSHPQSCFYNLTNVGRSDAGMYYCAVVTCEEILFGNGTSVIIDELYSEIMQNVILIGLAVLCTVSLTINIVFCISQRENGRTSQQIQTANDDTTTVQYCCTDEINYAALNLSTKRARRKRTSRPILRSKI